MRQRAALTRELFASLIKMIGVEMQIAEGIGRNSTALKPQTCAIINVNSA